MYLRKIKSPLKQKSSIVKEQILTENEGSSSSYYNNSQYDPSEEDSRNGESQEEELNRDSNPKYKTIFTSLEPPDKCKNLSNTVSFLKAQNDALLHEVCLYQTASRRNEKKMETVSREVDDLKIKLNDLQRINKCIEQSHAEVIHDYRRALSDTSRQLTERLEDLLKRNAEIEKELDDMKRNHRGPSPLKKKAQVELMAVARRLSTELEIERAKHKTEVDALKRALSEKEYQLAKLDACFQKQCNKMQEEASTMKKDMYSSEEEYIWPKEKIANQSSRIVRTPERTRQLINKIHEIDERYKKTIEEMERKNSIERAKQLKEIHLLQERLREMQQRTRLR